MAVLYIYSFEHWYNMVYSGYSSASNLVSVGFIILYCHVRIHGGIAVMVGSKMMNARNEGDNLIEVQLV